jgi:hypothetical protein
MTNGERAHQPTDVSAADHRASSNPFASSPKLPGPLRRALELPFRSFDRRQPCLCRLIRQQAVVTIAAERSAIYLRVGVMLDTRPNPAAPCVRR